MHPHLVPLQRCDRKYDILGLYSPVLYIHVHVHGWAGFEQQKYNMKTCQVVGLRCQFLRYSYKHGVNR